MKRRITLRKAVPVLRANKESPERAIRGFSLCVCIDMNLARGEIHRSNRPNLARVNPVVIFRRGREPDIFTQVGDWLAGAWRAYAVGRESDPTTVCRLNSGANIEVDTAV